MRLSQLGQIRMEYQATDQKRIKTEKWYKVDHNSLVEMPISNRAKRKQDLKEYLLKQTKYSCWQICGKNFLENWFNIL